MYTYSIRANRKIFKQNKKKKFNNISEKIGVYRLAYVDFLLQTKKKSFHLIDSDTYFFSNIILLDKEIKKLNPSVAFCKHNFYHNKSQMNNFYGIYNAGYIFFKYDKTSLNFLKNYRILCQNFISWHVKKNFKNNFADQTYLEDLLGKFKNIKIINHKGINCAPWNIGNYTLINNGTKFKVDKMDLIFFHFSGIRSLFNKIFFFNLYHYNKKNLSNVKKTIYYKYLNDLKNNQIQFRNKNIKIKFSLLKIYKLIKKILNRDFLII